MNIVSNIVTLIRKRYHGIITFLFLLCIWTVVTHLKLVSVTLFPLPETIVQTFLQNFESGLLGKSLLKSLSRIVQGFSIGCSLGFLLGAVMGVSFTAERLFTPLINALRQVPIIGWIPLIIVWCGIADMSKITFIAIGAFFPMVINTFEGIRSVPYSYVEVARVFEFGWAKLLCNIVVPGALPSIVSGVRLSLCTSWMLVVWSEINTRSGLGIGEMLWSARQSSKIDVVIVCIIVIGFVAFLINELLGCLESRLMMWKKR